MVAKLFRNINLNYLDMMSDGDEDMRNTMLSMLLDELPAEMLKMRTCTDNADWAELREVSHKMKSTLSFIGNNVMTTANAEIESITKGSGSPRQIPALMEILESQMPGVMDELHDCLNG